MKLLATAITFLSLAGASHAATVFAASDAGNLYRIDPATGVNTLVGPLGLVMFDIAYSNQYGLLGVSGTSGTSSLYTINSNTGAPTVVGSTGVFVNALTFSATGTLYAAGNSSFYSINPVTGAASLIGSDTGPNQYTSSGDLAFDNAGNLYLTSNVGGNDVLYRINIATGDGTVVGNVGFSQVYGLAYVNGVMYGFTGGGQQVLTINLTTGAGTAGPSDGVNAFGITATPEPGTLGLAGLALVGLGAARRRKRA